MKNFNKKRKKSNNTVNFDIDMLKDELIKKPVVYKSSKSDNKRKRK